MTGPRYSLVVFALVLALAVSAWTTDARAQDDEVEAAYSRYQSAIFAAKRCEKVSLDQQQHQVLADYIHAQIQDQLSSGRRLSLTKAAELEIKSLTNKGKRCNRPEIDELLAIYDDELAPLLE
jgi:hypothetical protein